MTPTPNPNPNPNPTPAPTPAPTPHQVQGRLLLALEGGYSLTELPRCAAACVRALLGEPHLLTEP